MGSIEMTDYERRQLAAQSLESNVRDENFCELFPELTMVIFTCALWLLFLLLIWFHFFCRQLKTKLENKIWPEPNVQMPK